jgi:hypothetical protein
MVRYLSITKCYKALHQEDAPDIGMGHSWKGLSVEDIFAVWKGRGVICFDNKQLGSKCTTVWRLMGKESYVPISSVREMLAVSGLVLITILSN